MADAQRNNLTTALACFLIFLLFTQYLIFYFHSKCCKVKDGVSDLIASLELRVGVRPARICHSLSRSPANSCCLFVLVFSFSIRP